MGEKQVQPPVYRAFHTPPPTLRQANSKAPLRTADNALDVIDPVTGDKIQYVQKPFPTGPQS